MRLWRISAHPGLAGIGGTFANGRWHTAPRAVTYAAEHPALAMVEVLARMRIQPDNIPRSLRLLAIDIADAGASYEPELPSGWHANEPTTQAVGDAWLASGTTLLMRVPSSVLPHAFNYLINPAHVSARKLVEVDLGPFWFDARLLR